MVVNRPLRIGLWFVAAISAVVCAREFMRVSDIGAYNAAVVTQGFETAGRHAGDQGIFARAHAAALAGQIDEARTLYGTLSNSTSPDLRVSAHYNLGNSYLRQALSYDREQEQDLALPLFELAKASYRQALQIDAEHWHARLNLVLALRHLPDADVRAPMELEFDTGAVRTIISADTEENLP